MTVPYGSGHVYNVRPIDRDDIDQEIVNIMDVINDLIEQIKVNIEDIKDVL